MKISKQVLNKSMLGLGGVSIAAVSFLGLTGAGSSLGSFIATITSQNNVIEGSSVEMTVIQLKTFSMDSEPLTPQTPMWFSDSTVSAVVGGMFPTLGPYQVPKETYFKIWNSNLTYSGILEVGGGQMVIKHHGADANESSAGVAQVLAKTQYSMFAKTSNAGQTLTGGASTLNLFASNGAKPFTGTSGPLILGPGKSVIVKFIGDVPSQKMLDLAVQGPSDPNPENRWDPSGVTATFPFTFHLTATTDLPTYL